jgi:hypothetical protein
LIITLALFIQGRQELIQREPFLRHGESNPISQAIERGYDGREQKGAIAQVDQGKNIPLIQAVPAAQLNRYGQRPFSANLDGGRIRHGSFSPFWKFRISTMILPYLADVGYPENSAVQAGLTRPSDPATGDLQKLEYKSHHHLWWFLL